ncbi:unnamed protein product [Phytomonas sp. EM1]|nr:unnamed protein product [Phytomonas sp. EM1]|eukprot:CCW63362.1 unnamed protein product [Phytomonas sp. isolate EM1]
MSSTTIIASKSGKPYLRPDTSKTYDYVPFTPARKSNFFERQVSRFSAEIGFNLMKPFEKLLCIIIIGAMMLIPFALFTLLKKFYFLTLAGTSSL